MTTLEDNTVINKTVLLNVYDFENHKMSRPLHKSLKTPVVFTRLNTIQCVSINGITAIMEFLKKTPDKLSLV